jgi:uncharacterized protein
LPPDDDSAIIRADVNRSGKPLPPDIDHRIERLAQRLASDPRVAAVWLFGSHARGEADALSDVDLALLAEGRGNRPELDRHREKWLLAAFDELGSEEVSLLVLNLAPVALRHAALRDAQLLWARRPELAADFEAWTRKEFFDFKRYLDAYDRELFARAAAGRLR